MFTKFFGKSTEKATLPTPISLFAPLSGELIPLENVSDPAFSQKMLGDGIAISPTNSKVLAPFDGIVSAIFPTGHAIGLRSAAGLECLIHIGIDTVSLNGDGFKLLVRENQKVGVGDPLITLDLPFLQQSGKDLTTPVVITNSDVWKVEPTVIHSDVTAGKDAILLVSPITNE